jgi:hypothetical protein
MAQKGDFAGVGSFAIGSQDIRMDRMRKSDKNARCFAAKKATVHPHILLFIFFFYFFL